MPIEFFKSICAEVESLFRYDPCANFGVSFVFRRGHFTAVRPRSLKKMSMKSCKKYYFLQIFKNISNMFRVLSQCFILNWN